MLLPLLLLTACTPTEVTLLMRGPLEGAAHMPVVVSPDESCLLYFKRVGEGNASKYVYCLAGSDGSSQRELFATPVDWDDMLNSVTSANAFSADGRKVVVAMMRTTKEGDFRSTLHHDASPAVVRLSPEERSTAVRAARAIGLNVAGVDLLRSNHGPVVMEVNSSPGLEGIERATGKDVASLIVEFIEKNARRDRTRTRGKG